MTFRIFVAGAAAALTLTMGMAVAGPGESGHSHRSFAAGEPGNPNGNTIYAGTLDDTAQFKPVMAIMTKFKPDWVVLPEGLTIYEGMPG